MRKITEATSTVWTWNKVTPIRKKSKDNEGKGEGEGEPGDAGDDEDDTEPKSTPKPKEPKPTPEPKEPTGPRKITPDDIDNNARRIQDQMSKGKDQSPADRPAPKQGDKTPTDSGGGGRGAGDYKGHEIDYSKIRPTFNWQTILKRFIMSASNKTEETYAKPSRRGVAGLDIMKQTGAAAIKPAEKPLEFNDTKLCFVFDVSGSMETHNAKVFAESVSILKMPQYKNSEVAIIKFSGDYYLFKVNFNRDKGASVPSLLEKPKQWPMTAKQVVGYQVSGATVFGSGLSGEIMGALNHKWNVIIFSDSDILSGANFANLVALIKAKPKQVSVIFDSHSTYVRFRQLFGGATPLIGHF